MITSTRKPRTLAVVFLCFSAVLFLGVVQPILAQVVTSSVSQTAHVAAENTQLHLLQSLVTTLQIQLASLKPSPAMPFPSSGMLLSGQTTTINVDRAAFYTQVHKCVLGRAITSSAAEALSTLPNKSFEEVYGSFFFSAEYVNKNVTNEQYVEQLYRCILGRAPEAVGAANWVKLLSSGNKDREQVLKGFVGSKEFMQIVLPKMSPQLGFSTSSNTSNLQKILS